MRKKAAGWTFISRSTCTYGNIILNSENAILAQAIRGEIPTRDGVRSTRRDGVPVFSAILIEKDDSGQSVARTGLDDEQTSGRRRHRRRRVLDTELQGRPGHHRQVTGRAQVPDGARHRSRRHRHRQRARRLVKTGDRVVLNGWGVGETHWGGFAQRARLDGDWLVPLPAEFTTRQAMAIGTAGYTASLCVDALLRARRRVRIRARSW